MQFLFVSYISIKLEEKVGGKTTYPAGQRECAKASDASRRPLFSSSSCSSDAFQISPPVPLPWRSVFFQALSRPYYPLPHLSSVVSSTRLTPCWTTDWWLSSCFSCHPSLSLSLKLGLRDHSADWNTPLGYSTIIPSSSHTNGTPCSHQMCSFLCVSCLRRWCHHSPSCSRPWHSLVHHQT